jgi:spore maturation protein B
MMIAIIPLIILFVMCYGMMKEIKVYDCFVEGAKEGLTVCYKIFPYLLAMIIAVSVFRESRALDFIITLLSPLVKLIGLPSELIPLVLVKPLSGSGALGIYMEILKNYGPDTYIGRVGSIIMGSTETIFYTITIYFGAIGIKKIRHTLWAAIMADLVAIIMAVTLARIMFS